MARSGRSRKTPASSGTPVPTSRSGCSNVLMPVSSSSRTPGPSLAAQPEKRACCVSLTCSFVSAILQHLPLLEVRGRANGATANGARLAFLLKANGARLAFLLYSKKFPPPTSHFPLLNRQACFISLFKSVRYLFRPPNSGLILKECNLSLEPFLLPIS